MTDQAPTVSSWVVAPATTVEPGRTTRHFSGRQLLAGGVAIVLALAAIGSFGGSPADRPTAALASPTPAAVIPSSTPTPEPTTMVPAPTFGPTGPTTVATVVRVIDGDTIVVSYDGQEHKVRYIGMDAPETQDPLSIVEWMGPEATAANIRLVEGKTVYLETDVSEVDRFDRLLRHVWLDEGGTWTLVNLELVRLGVATAISYPPDTMYDGLYGAASADAHVSALGLWASSPVPVATSAPTPQPTPKPTPKATAKPKPASKCHPSYDPCLPIVDDLDCPDVRRLGKAPVDVIGPDVYRLDRDKDGIGCE